MKFLNIRIAFLAIALLSIGACKSPTTDIKIVENMDVIKYSALLHIADANGVAPENINISVTGDAASDVYEISGKKEFTVVGGMITIGLGPAVTPAAGSDVKVNVVISAAGYNSVTQPVTFVNGTMQQVVSVTMTKVGSPSSVSVSLNPPAPGSSIVDLDFSGYCANKTNIEIKPSLYVFFRESNSGKPFQYMGFMQDGHIETNLLSTGKTYDFEVNYAGENYVVTQQINQTAYALTLNLGTAICDTY